MLVAALGGGGSVGRDDDDFGQGAVMVAEQLAQGGRLELTLTHATPLPESLMLLATVNALELDDEVEVSGEEAPGEGGGEQQDDTCVQRSLLHQPPDVTARARQGVARFLERKLLRLLVHLDGWAVAHFKTHIHHSPPAALGWTTGGAPTERDGLPVVGWLEFVRAISTEDSIGIGSGGRGGEGSSAYATSPPGSVGARVDSQVAVLHHALEEARGAGNKSEASVFFFM